MLYYYAVMLFLWSAKILYSYVVAFRYLCTYLPNLPRALWATVVLFIFPCIVWRWLLRVRYSTDIVSRRMPHCNMLLHTIDSISCVWTKYIFTNLDDRKIQKLSVEQQRASRCLFWEIFYAIVSCVVSGSCLPSNWKWLFLKCANFYFVSM